MPSKYIQRNFAKGHWYHIYNRGAHKQKIFLSKKDYSTFTQILSYYLKYPTGYPRSHVKRKSYKSPNVQGRILDIPTYELTTYCLMPNHFHLLLKQTHHPTHKNNISNFMKRLCITYSMYFNNKYDHTGGIFEGKYKNVTINSENQLLYLTEYIHLNPSKPLTYLYSSLSDYLGKTHNKWIKSKQILSYFSKSNPNLTYQSFLFDTKTDFKPISNLLID